MWTKLRVRFLKTFRSFSFLEFCSVLNFDITALRDILVCHEAMTIFIYFMNYLTYNRISNGAANRRLPFQIVYSQKSGKLGEVAMSMFLRCGDFQLFLQHCKLSVAIFHVPVEQRGKSSEQTLLDLTVLKFSAVLSLSTRHDFKKYLSVFTRRNLPWDYDHIL